MRGRLTHTLAVVKKAYETGGDDEAMCDDESLTSRPG